MTVSIAAAASSSVSLASVQGAPRDTVTVVVDLSTTDAVSAVDITIPLGSYLKYAQNSVVLSSARSNGHVVSASQVGDNLRLLVYSLTLSALNGTNGELLRFDLVLGKEPGVYALTPQVVLSNASGATISSTSTAGSVTILTPKIMLNATEIDFGHIPIRSTYTRYLTISNTGTATLNVTGITFDDAELSCQQTYSIAAGSSQSVTINYAPKTHGAVTAKMTIASDATNGSQKVNIKADPFSVNELHLLNSSGIADDTIEVFMRMNNMENIVGMQSSFKMPESLIFVPNSFSVTPRGADHLAMASMSHDTLTLMAYSPTNTPFTGNDDTLCSFKVRLNGSSGYHYLTPFNVVLANVAGVNMMSATSNGYVYINSPRINVPSQLNMGNVSVTETKRAGLRIYNNSNVDLKVGKVTFLAEGYSVVSRLPMTVQGYGYDTLWVEYHPTVEGNFSTTMQVYSNDPISRMTSVNVYGTAFEPNELNVAGNINSNGDYMLNIGLDNYSDIVAVQMDIHWLDSMATSLSALTLAQRTAGMTPMVSKMSEGTYRVALFSMSNSPISGHDGNLFDLVYDGDIDFNHSTITIDNIIASDRNGVNKISVPEISMYVSLQQVTVGCDTTMGRVVGGGIFNVGDTATIVAIPKEHYHVESWSNGDTAEVLKIVVAGDTLLTANFAMNYYNVTCVSNDTLLGSVVGGGNFLYGTTITMTASEREHCHFVSWSHGDTSRVISLSVDRDTNLVATFELDQHVVSGSASTGGNVTGYGTYDYGTEITLTAVANTHYHFVSWSNGNTDDSMTLTVLADTMINASFEIDRHVITVNANDAAMGQVSGGGEYDYGQTVTLTATPNQHYHFVSWSNGETTPTINVTVSGNQTLTATFAIDRHNVTASSNDVSMGSATGGGEYDYGSTVTLTATPNQHYHFVSWSNGMTTPSITLTVNGEINVVATFAPNRYTITTSVNDSTMGSVTGGGEYDYGDIVNLQAIANAHYHFVSWNNGATDESLSVTVGGDMSFIATFAPDVYVVTANANIPEGGAVTGSGTYSYNDVAVITAYPKYDYTFTGWSNGETDLTIYVVVESDTTITAYYEKIDVAIDNVEGKEYVVAAEQGQVVVKGAEKVAIYDAAGRLVCVGKSADEELQRFRVNATGVYFVVVDDKKSIKIVVTE